MSQPGASSVEQAAPHADVTPMPQELPRPALKDRQCTQREKLPRGKSQNKLPRAGTYTNNRVSRNSSASGLPRGRSFQGSRALSPSAQAAQDGYNQRKAAKLYAEKRRAQMLARMDADGKVEEDSNTSSNAVSDRVINITVDDKGVKIDSATGSSQPTSGMGSRKGSRSRMTRSTSKQRTSMRADDKENAGGDGQRALDAEINAYFSRKRGSTDQIGARKEPFSEPPSAWDGSMPKRQNSRSFIDQKKKAIATVKDATTAPNTVGSTPTSNRSEPELTIPDTGMKQSSAPDAKHTVTSLKNPTTDTSADIETTPQSPSTSKASESTADGSFKSARSTLATPGALKTDSLPTESSTESPHFEQASRASTENSRAGTVGCSRNLPMHGKWCNECAGLGLHISALLSELEKQHSSIDNNSEGSSSSPGTRKGWKNIVLGESKSKSSSERTRLQQEVSVLRATVEFLYKKIEAHDSLTDNDPTTRA